MEEEVNSIKADRQVETERERGGLMLDGKSKVFASICTLFNEHLRPSLGGNVK